MDNLAAQQVHIHLKQTEIKGRYPRLWSRVISQWRAQDAEDRAWLIYSANYLFRTGNVRWAIDPIRLKQRLDHAPEMEFVKDLDKLSFVLLTHEHADHLDFNLLYALRELPILWIVPEPILPEVLAKSALPDQNIIIPKAMVPIQIKGIRILPFDGLHREHLHTSGTFAPQETVRGVSSMGYLVEFSGKRWLFPGDTRTYDARQLPSFGALDGIFAHLWLGRACALIDEPPLAAAFCRFCVALEPRKIVVTHLEEYGRQAEDYWSERHFKIVQRWFREHAPEVHVEAAHIGESISL
ncbi:MAG: MBL fold metallo-hydrolase [Anaerolineales bacterium]|nr:MAG: MBL fold metallo-hydrolase [Anaerolineales bacterium]